MTSPLADRLAIVAVDRNGVSWTSFRWSDGTFGRQWQDSRFAPLRAVSASGYLFVFDQEPGGLSVLAAGEDPSQILAAAYDVNLRTGVIDHVEYVNLVDLATNSDRIIPVAAVAAAQVRESTNVGPEVHVVVIGADQGLWHTLRSVSGSGSSGWQPSWGQLLGQVREPDLAFRSVSCAGTTAGLHVVATDSADNQPWYTLRRPDRSWLPTYDPIQTGADPVTNWIDIAAIGIADELHVVGVNSGRLRHTVRHADGTWFGQWGSIADQVTNPGVGIFTAVSCARVDDELHVVGRTQDGGLNHTIRHADGTWQDFYGAVEDQEANNPPGGFVAVTCAGLRTDGWP